MTTRDFDQELNPPIEEPVAPAYVLSSGWTGFLAGRGMSLLESSLATWLPKQRWFGAKTRAIRGVRVREWTELPSTSERYFAPGRMNRVLCRSLCSTSKLNTQTTLRTFTRFAPQSSSGLPARR